MVGQPAYLVILVTQPSVDPKGIVHSPPVVDTAVVLNVGAGWALSGSNSRPTVANGTVLFSLTCDAPGGALSAAVGGGPTVGLAVPACVEPPPPTATAAPPPPTIPAGPFGLPGAGGSLGAETTTVPSGSGPGGVGTTTTTLTPGSTPPTT
jgi:hypothetical protein